MPPRNLSLFDVEMAQKLRDDGIELAAGAHVGPLANAQAVARYLGRDGMTTDMDLVWKYLLDHGYEGHELGNAAGSVFPSSEWYNVGYKKSDRVSTHRRVIGRWRLRILNHGAFAQSAMACSESVHSK